MLLTREDILALYEQGPDAVATAVLQMQSGLVTRISRLEERLGLDSHNSSKPPSSDQPGGSRAERRSRTKKTGKKKPGAQPGHPGSTLKRVAEPDYVQTHAPKQCPACKRSVTDRAMRKVGGTRQVFDIEPVVLRVTEHQVLACTCQCGCRVKGEFPREVTAPAQYGPNFLGYGLFLMSGHHVPVGRTVEILAEMTGQRPSEGTLLEGLKRLDGRIDRSIEAIIEGLLAARQMFADETGMRVDGTLWWLHVLSTALLTHYAIDRRRGSSAIEDIGILQEYTDGQLMHDFWSSYRTSTPADHGYCVAHLLRELIRLSERSTDMTHAWADELLMILTEAINLRREAVENGTYCIDPQLIDSLRRRYSLHVTRGMQLFGEATSGKNSDEFNLLRRLREHRHEILAFLDDPYLEPTNNQAERDLRMGKLRQKISGCFRSPDMAMRYARVRSYLSTARKNGVGFLKAIVDALNFSPFVPQIDVGT